MVAAVVHFSAGGRPVQPASVAVAATLAAVTSYLLLTASLSLTVSITACALDQFGMHWLYNLDNGGVPVGSVHQVLEAAGAHVLAAVVTALWLSHGGRSLGLVTALLRRCFQWVPMPAALNRAAALAPVRTPAVEFLPPSSPRIRLRTRALPERGPPER